MRSRGGPRLQRLTAQQIAIRSRSVSDLMRGKIELFGVDSLVNMLAAAGLHLEVSLARAA